MTKSVQQHQEEIEERMKRLAPLVVEHSRLQEAEQLLAEIAERIEPGSEVSVAKATPRRTRRTRSPRRKNEPIGAEGTKPGRRPCGNELRRRVLNAIDAAPGMKRPQITDITGATLNAIYTVTGELGAEGRIEIRGRELYPVTVMTGRPAAGSSRRKSEYRPRAHNE
jgi:hypothetical protein